MTPKLVGIILLFVGSELLGLALGEWNNRLFLHTIPPMALSGFNQATAHGAFLLYGAAGGLAIFLWALVAVLLAGLFRGSARPRTDAAN